MYGYKYISKKQSWVSNGNGGQTLKRTYTYNGGDSTFAIFLLGVLFASPFFIIRKIKERERFSNHNPLIKRLRERQQRSLEKLQQTRQSLWNIIKNKRKGESDNHLVKRLKRYGFTTDGIHIKTRINYQLNIETEKSKMSVDIKRKLKELEGEIFYTKKRIPFSYKFISESTVRICEKKAYNISISDFEKAIESNPKKPSEVTNLVRGSSYIFGIITDSRFN